LSYGCAWI